MAIRYTSDMKSEDIQLSIRQGGCQPENHSISNTEVFFDRDWCKGCIEDEKKHIQLGGHDVEFVVATSKSSSRTIFGLRYGPDNQIKIHSCDGMVPIINSKPVTVDFRCSWEVNVNVNDIISVRQSFDLQILEVTIMLDRMQSRPARIARFIDRIRSSLSFLSSA
jgi:hypothetical protein